MILPKDLRCEYQHDPIAVDCQAPRFSWVNVSAGRDASQLAYQITVRSKGDTVWDSGKVSSPIHHLIAYHGQPLESNAEYEWSVRVWDGDGSQQSDTSFFETAILSADEWSASWITMKSPKQFQTLTRRVVGDIVGHEEYLHGHYWALYFHKTFVLKPAPARGRIHVTGLGYYQLFVNGTRAGDRHLDPAQTDYRHGAYYATLDITDSLRDGDNAIGIVVGNGRHIGPFGYGKPMAIAQLVVTLADCSKQQIVTDATWTASHGPVHENGIYLGEVRDERDALPGWSTSVFDPVRPKSADSESAMSTAGPAEVVSEGPVLSAQQLPPVRVTKTLYATKIHSPDPGVHVFDFGERGERVTMRFSELIDADGRLHLGTNREAAASDTYVLGGDAEEIYEPSFTYHGFRYVEVRGYPGVPDSDSLVALVTHTAVRQTGGFRCGKPLFNRIHEAIIRGQVSNLSSVPTDCPQRGERMGWLGDAQLTSDEAVHNFDMARFYTKYLEDIRRSVREDGALSDVTPPYWPLYPADPAWGTAYATIAWNMYLYYGDCQILERHYDGIQAYIDFLERSSEDHIVRMGKYGDWCPPACTYPKRTPVALTSTFYYYKDTDTFAHIAEVLGRDADARSYRKRADAIRDAFNREFNRGGIYAFTGMSPIDHHCSQTSQLLPLALGLVPEADREKCEQILMREVAERFDYHPDTGIVGMKYLLPVLSATGHPETAYRVLSQTSYPSLGYMIEQGATTLWERWENLSGVGMNSHNHIMFGSVDTWFYATLCGIRILEPAWTSFAVKPWLPPEMSHAEATLETVQGHIRVAWRRVSGGVELDLRVPVGSRAEVSLPLVRKREILEDGRPVTEGSHEGIVSIDRRADEAMLAVGSGAYEFAWATAE